MTVFADLPAAPPAGPPLWSAPLQQRLRHLLRGDHKVAWVYRAPDTSTFRYRAINTIAAMESDGSTDFTGAWFSDDELDDLGRVIHLVDTVVVTRFPYSASLRRLIDRARRHDVRLLFDCDDMVFDPVFAPTILDSLGRDPNENRDWDQWFAYMGRLHATIRECDGGITTNETLAAKMGPYFPSTVVSVVPNVLHRAQEGYSRQLLEAKAAVGWERSGPVSIGYFSGTPSHVRDFGVAAPALARLLEADPDVTLRVVGYLDVVDDILGPYAGRISFVPFMDFVRLQREIADVDINIAPLQHNAFNSCKSDLKFFEAAVVGTWTIAARTPPFARSIVDGVTGQLCREHEWDGALAEAVELARDRSRYADLSDKAAREAYASHGWESIRDAVRKAVLPV